MRDSSPCTSSPLPPRSHHSRGWYGAGAKSAHDLSLGRSTPDRSLIPGIPASKRRRRRAAGDGGHVRVGAAVMRGTCLWLLSLAAFVSSVVGAPAIVAQSAGAVRLAVSDPEPGGTDVSYDSATAAGFGRVLGGVAFGVWPLLSWRRGYAPLLFGRGGGDHRDRRGGECELAARVRTGRGSGPACARTGRRPGPPERGNNERLSPRPPLHRLPRRVAHVAPLARLPSTPAPAPRLLPAPRTSATRGRRTRAATSALPSRSLPVSL